MKAEHIRQPQILSSQRLDSWLWAARFYKTRKLAAEAASAGHVTVNDSRAKPGKEIKLGDQLNVKKNHEQYHLHIKSLSKNRLPAKLAIELFEESEDSLEQRLREREIRSLNRAGVKYNRRKPSKRDRQQLLRIKNQSPSPD